MQEARVPNQRLIDHRKQRGWSQQDLVNGLVALGNRCGERNLGLTFKQVSRWEQGWARPRPPYTKLLCMLFEASANELGLTDPPPLRPRRQPAPAAPARSPTWSGQGPGSRRRPRVRTTASSWSSL